MNSKLASNLQTRQENPPKEQTIAIITQTHFFYQREMLKFQPSIRTEREVTTKHLDAVQGSLNYFEVLVKNQGWMIPSTWRNEVQLKLDRELQEILQQMKYEDEAPVEEINSSPTVEPPVEKIDHLPKLPQVPLAPEVIKTHALKQIEIKKPTEIIKITHEPSKSDTVFKDNKIPHDEPNSTKIVVLHQVPNPTKTVVSNDELEVLPTKSKPKEKLKQMSKQMSPEVQQLLPKQAYVFKPTKFVLSNGALQKEKDTEVTALQTEKFQFKTPSAFVTMRSYTDRFLTSSNSSVTRNPGFASIPALDKTTDGKADKTPLETAVDINNNNLQKLSQVPPTYR